MASGSEQSAFGRWPFYGAGAQRSGRAIGLIEPCLPWPAKAPPSDPDWLHEIRHDGFLILARRDAAGVRLYTRNGHDFTKRFPLVAATVAMLPARSCLIDGSHPRVISV
jgi:ATP-dependent DNA ligase